MKAPPAASSRRRQPALISGQVRVSGHVGALDDVHVTLEDSVTVAGDDSAVDAGVGAGRGDTYHPAADRRCTA
ncbi:hypothetical protein AXA44_33660 [Rhodococcus sp. SC4]|nr:hypothetical protein AXA44_33660 [Rhodococcus sp. SC4]